jgi:hypothetical protein
MARFQHAITNFSGGVMSPRLTTRVDSDTFNTALALGENFIVSPHGGLQARRGFQDMAGTTLSRIFQFHRGGDKDDITVVITTIDVNTSRIDLYTDENWVTPIATFTDLLSPVSEDLYFHNTERLGVIVHPDHPPYYIDVTETGAYKGGHLTFDRVPSVIYYDDKSPQVASTDSTYELTFPADWVSGDRYKIIYGNDVAFEGADDRARLFLPAWSEGLATSDAVNAESIRQGIKGTIWAMSNASLVTVVANTTLAFTVTYTGPGSGRDLDIINEQGQRGDVEVLQKGIFTTGAEPAWSYPNVVLHNGNYYQCIKPNWPIEAPGPNDNEPGVSTPDSKWEEFWLDLGATKPDWYDYQYPDGNPWNGQNPGDLENTTDAVVYGVWDRGWPQVAVFFQQRLIVFALDDQPTTVYGTRIGDYRDWQPGVGASDPFIFDLDTSDSPKIKHAEVTQSALVIGTSAGDFRLGGDVTLGPTDVQLTKQNSARSYKTRAVSMQNTAFYIEQGREKLRGTLYGRDRNSWTSTEMSLVAEHLFYEKISRLVLVQAPDVMLYALRDDGNLVAMAWVPAGQSYQPAFTEIITSGTVVDICGYYSSSAEEDYLLALVNHSGNYRIERMPYPERDLQERTKDADITLTEQGIVHMDAWITGQLIQSNLINAPFRYNNTVVDVQVNDAYVGKILVDELGRIILPEDYEVGDEYAFGYGYICTGTTFELGVGNQRGVTLGTKRRWNKVYARLLDSALPTINGQLPEDRTPALVMGVAETLRAGLQDPVITDLGYNDGVLTVVQDKPYPTHVLSLFGEVSVDNA